MASRQCGIVDLPSLGRSKSAFDQPYVAADDRGYVDSGFQPMTIENWNTGVGRAQDNISSSHRRARGGNRCDVDIQQLSHFVREFSTVLRSSAIHFHVLDPADFT